MIKIGILQKKLEKNMALVLYNRLTRNLFIAKIKFRVITKGRFVLV